MELQNICNKLPSDICNYIQDLHYSNYHYEIMKKNINKIEIKGTLMTLNRCYYVDEDNTTRNERINYVKKLSKCKCCNKHINDRPTFLQYLNGYVPKYNTKHHTYYSCNCNCKYYIDAFCWIDNDEIVDFNNNNNNQRQRSTSNIY